MFMESGILWCFTDVCGEHAGSNASGAEDRDKTGYYIGNLTNINPNDIASFDILKDRSAIPRQSSESSQYIVLPGST